MAYKSPIEIISGEVQTKLEGDVLKVIQNYDITVDKDELLKALAYDRDQYRKGWEDGWVHAKWDIIRCKDCAYAVDHDGEYVYCSVHDAGFKLDGFCSEGEPVGEVYNG